MKRSELQRKTRLRRGRPLTKRNPARKAAAFARHFQSKERVAWINSFPCECGGRHPACSGRTVNAHVRSRAAGGAWRDVIPLSWGCHRFQSDHGWEAYGASGGLTRADAEQAAERLASSWK